MSSVRLSFAYTRRCCENSHLAVAVIAGHQQPAGLLHYFEVTHKGKDPQLELKQTWLLSDLVSDHILLITHSSNTFGLAVQVAVDFGESCEVVFTFDVPYR